MSVIGKGVAYSPNSGLNTTRGGVITTMSAPPKSFKTQINSATSTPSAVALSGLYYDRFDNKAYY